MVDVENAEEEEKKKLEECDKGEEGSKEETHPANGLAEKKVHVVKKKNSRVILQFLTLPGFFVTCKQYPTRASGC